jgi:hypothetical protein
VIVARFVLIVAEASLGDLLEAITLQKGVIAHQAGVIDTLTAEARTSAAQIEGLTAQVAELRRRLGLDSSNSSKPPSSDGLKKPPARSLRKKSGRKPGKQRGAEGKTLRQVAEANETLEHRPAVCVGCEADLADADVVRVQRRQLIELPEFAPRVIEHRVMSCRCDCGTVTVGTAPAGVNAPVQYGPGSPRRRCICWWRSIFRSSGWSRSCPTCSASRCPLAGSPAWCRAPRRR